MLKVILLRLKASSFIRECVLFDSNIPFYWLLGVMVWGSIIMFLYAGLSWIRLEI